MLRHSGKRNRTKLTKNGAPVKFSHALSLCRWNPLRTHLVSKLHLYVQCCSAPPQISRETSAQCRMCRCDAHQNPKTEKLSAAKGENATNVHFRSRFHLYFSSGTQNVEREKMQLDVVDLEFQTPRNTLNFHIWQLSAELCTALEPRTSRKNRKKN